jgi:sugar lactone lactonase YvrE
MSRKGRKPARPVIPVTDRRPETAQEGGNVPLWRVLPKTNAPMTVTRLLALAALLGTAAPLAAQAGSAPRVATILPPHSAPAALPAIDLITALRHQAGAAPRTEASKNKTPTLDYPYGITVDIYGNLYAANLFAGVTVYNDKYQLTGTITTGLSTPAAVAVSFAGNIYVANNTGNNITVYNPQYQQIGTISDSTLINPSSMFIDADDTVWALDGTGTLHAYLSDGTTIASTQTGGTVVGPWGPNVTVWGVADPNGGYIEVLENRATGVHDGLSLGTEIGDSPYGAGEAQDQFGQQYTSDFYNSQIEIWSSNGLDEIGQFSTPAPPYGVAVDTIHNRLYVALTTQSEIYVYSTTPPYKLLHVIH